MEDSDGMTTASESAPASKAKSAAREFAEIIKTVVYALLIAFVIRVLLFQPFTIPSGSMEPNLLQGDYIIVSKYSYGYSRYSLSLPWTPHLFDGRILEGAPHRGDIVVFKLPRDDKVDYIKRLIGLPGDRIQMKAGQIWLNGKPVPRQELALPNETTPLGTPVHRFRETLPSGKTYVTNDYGPGGDVDDTDVYVVPPHHYFMMGDNRDNSQDSRFPESYGVGYVPEENLVGKAQIILLSWNPDASIFKPWTWVLNARPSRFLHLLQ